MTIVVLIGVTADALETGLFVSQSRKKHELGLSEEITASFPNSKLTPKISLAQRCLLSAEHSTVHSPGA